MKKLYFITNLQSGKSIMRGKLAAVVDQFTAAGFEVTVRTTQGRKDATAAAEYACLTGLYDLLVCS
ncbi:MAG: lipid kinase, partial [Oscillospiraceae bacterium]|nr:lipid kinase [Oscillospiraceae bacterium]